MTHSFPTRRSSDRNAAVRTNIPFNPAVKDGRRTEGLEVPKTNWANTIDEGPFEAYAITCGVTFTFGGIKIDTQGRAISVDDAPIPSLFRSEEHTSELQSLMRNYYAVFCLKN